MNREILFRGKCVDNGEWVEGCFWKDIWGDNTEYIYYDGEDYEVIPETVGQYTGLTDKNDKKIFEGDIVTYKEKIYTVDWCDDCVSFVLPCINYPELETDFRPFYGTDLEVIGNIHDNPELLEVSE